MTQEKPNVAYYLELAARLYAALMLSIYGSGKIMGGQFHRFGRIPEEIGLTPLAEVGGFDLAWTFFGYSFGYIVFIGGSQLLGSFLLLFERTKLLGVAVLLPILANIVVVDFFFTISTGAMLSAVFYLLALIYVLIYNWSIVRSVLSRLTEKRAVGFGRRYEKWLRFGVAVLFILGFFFLEQQMLNVVGR